MVNKLVRIRNKSKLTLKKLTLFSFKQYKHDQNLSIIYLKRTAQGSDLTPIFGDLSQSEKLSEIKPTLSSLSTDKFALKLRTSYIAPSLITMKHFGSYADPAENILDYLPIFLMRSRRNVFVSRFSFIQVTAPTFEEINLKNISLLLFSTLKYHIRSQLLLVTFIYVYLQFLKRIHILHIKMSFIFVDSYISTQVNPSLTKVQTLLVSTLSLDVETTYIWSISFLFIYFHCSKM